MNDLLERAVCNNARWCAQVCAAHGAQSRFSDAAWICEAPAPRYYPNVVTLRADARVEWLGQFQDLPPGWGVKDSFHALDLASLGFRAAIQGHWLHHCEAPAPVGELDWRPVETSEALAQWEAAWGGEDHSAQPRIFLPALLADAGIRIFGGYAGQRICAGGVVSQAEGVIGLSNVFAIDPPLAAEVIRHAHSLCDGRPLVGWETPDKVGESHVLGPLQVWLHEGPQGRALP